MKSESNNKNNSLYWSILKLSRNNKVFRVVIDWLAYLFYRLFRRHKVFTFEGKSYKYFYHLYNRTVAGERVVEIPLAKELLGEYFGKKILEVGNVMPHYFKINHDVLDKYEKAKGVINKDVVTFKPKKKYDLILAISTLEHVGYSYGEKKDPDKFLKAVGNLKTLLADGGLLFTTFPIYLNPGIDNLFKKNRMPFDEEYYMKRVSFWNEWEQIDRKIAEKKNNYDSVYANANILFIGKHRNKR